MADETHWPEYDEPWDYGEGKTRAQEAEDSVYMLGMVMLAAFVALALIGLVLILLFV